MKIILLILILFTAKFNFSQQFDLVKLKSSFVRLKNSNTSSTQLAYFNSFPKSFEEFSFCFDYNNHEQKEVSENYENYINTFFSLDSVDIGMQIQKWIQISVEAYHKPDATHCFLKHLYPKISNLLVQYYTILDKYPEPEIETFHRFLFSYKNINGDEVPEEFQIFGKQDKEFYLHLKKGFNQAQKLKKR